jgi:peptide/nickel transport system substrate-binding protein
MSGRAFGRRELLRAAALAGAAGAISGLSGLSGCAVPEGGDDGNGMLRIGMAGGSTSDTLDPRTFVDFVPINVGYQIMNGLVEIDDQGRAVPELFESWEPQGDARVWAFTLRSGVVFHNGKTLAPEDVVYSINLHRGRTPSAAQAVVANIADVRKLDATRIQVTLTGGDADLPATLADFRLLVVPDGFADWANPIGTGAYRLEVFEPGIRCITRKAGGGYWKANAGHVEAIEVLVIGDPIARINALISGQVDVISPIDGRTAELLRRNPTFQVVRSPTGQYPVFAMNCEADPYANQAVRLALKYAIDRERLLKTVLNGYGSVGNDQPIPPTSWYHAPDLTPHTYDPDQARHHLRRAGLERLEVSLDVSDAAFSGALDAAILYQAAAAEAGISIAVRRRPADGYWSAVWMQAPFCGSYSDGRTTVDAAFTKAYKSTSASNETRWHRPEFDRLANLARAELDVLKRKELYGVCQRMICDDGGALIPVFMDHIEAGSDRVRGWKPSALYGLMGQRIGEKVWFA